MKQNHANYFVRICSHQLYEKGYPLIFWCSRSNWKIKQALAMLKRAILILVLSISSERKLINGYRNNSHLVMGKLDMRIFFCEIENLINTYTSKNPMTMYSIQHGYKSISTGFSKKCQY